ncbi:MAG: LytTR family DNA-binding domain-containing protein [Balneolaceae bacterium]
MSIKCIIVEDEPVARDILRQYILDVPDLKLEKEFEDGLSAASYLKTSSVDLIFLDINMPKLSGISFLKSLKNPPKVILTTAYSEYALEGYELDIVDYLLKPFSFERFLKAVQKIEPITSPNVVDDSLTIKADGKHYRVSFSDIQSIEAQGDYLTLITDTKRLTFYKTLKSILEELPSSKFLRVHKSFVINLDKIDFVEGNIIHLSGKEVPIGKSFKSDFEAVFLK